MSRDRSYSDPPRMKQKSDFSEEEYDDDNTPLSPLIRNPAGRPIGSYSGAKKKIKLGLQDPDGNELPLAEGPRPVVRVSHNSKKPQQDLVKVWKELEKQADLYELWSLIFNKLREKFKEDLEEMMFPTKRRKDFQTKVQYVYAFEDLTSKDVEKLTTIPELSRKIPCWKTLHNWRNELTQEMWDYGVHETALGISVNCYCNNITTISIARTKARTKARTTTTTTLTMFFQL
jgi:hypothetical protein